MAPGPQPNMQQLLKQAQKMQQQLMDAQAELADTQVEARPAAGWSPRPSPAAASCCRLAIDPKAVDPDDTETLDDLVLAAVRDATGNAPQLKEQKMGPLTQGSAAWAAGCPVCPSAQARRRVRRRRPRSDRRARAAAQRRSQKRAADRVSPAGR